MHYSAIAIEAGQRDQRPRVAVSRSHQLSSPIEKNGSPCLPERLLKPFRDQGHVKQIGRRRSLPRLRRRKGCIISVGRYNAIESDRRDLRHGASHCLQALSLTSITHFQQDSHRSPARRWQDPDRPKRSLLARADLEPCLCLEAVYQAACRTAVEDYAMRV